jgi:hypothetical protein
MLALDIADERLQDEESKESISFLRRVAHLGGPEEKRLAEEYGKKSGNRKKLRGVLRGENVKVREIGELGPDGTGVIDAEFVDEK